MSQQIYRGLCIHWDHHPHPVETPHYGAGTDAEQIRRYLRAVRPDVTQYHTIGCYGYASYPSHIAPPVPGLVGDPLATWAQVCAEEGVPFGCYVASFDCGYPQPVPQWRCVSRAGAPSDRHYCPNGPWTDQFFIPLLLEIMERYHPAHFWFDGVWLPGREDSCFCEHCQRSFHQQYGRPLPKQPTPADWVELQDFYEHALDAAVARIGQAIKAHDPRIRLACNSLYYFKDLRPPIPEVDWLSWDVVNTPNLHVTAFEATYLATAGKPADLMVFEEGILHWQPRLSHRPRPLAQLKSEAGVLLAHGVRVNLWQNPDPDGAIPPEKATVARPLAAFVRERQEWCIDNDSVAEVALLASRRQHCLDAQAQSRAMRAAHQWLQEAHIPCDVVCEDTLWARLGQYRVVVLPEIGALDVTGAERLRAYLETGGQLFLVPGEPTPDGSGWQAAILGPAAHLEAGAWAKSGVLHQGRLVRLECQRFHARAPWRCLVPYADQVEPWLAELTVGQGRVLAVTSAALSDYAETHWPAARDLLTWALRLALPEPLVEIEGHPGVELVINRRGTDLYVHLVNLTADTGFGGSQFFFDEVPVYADVAITVRPPHLPTQVLQMPGEAPLAVARHGAALRVILPRVEAHAGICLKDAWKRS